MKLMKHLPDGRIVETNALYFDAYSFGDRLLEGLPVKITIDSSGEPQISADWPKGLDKAYWLDKGKKALMEFIEDDDVFCTSAHLDDDDGFIIS